MDSLNIMNAILWFYKLSWGNRDILGFLNNDLKKEEEYDYLERIHTYPETHSHKDFKEKASTFGTFAIVTNLE